MLLVFVCERVCACVCVLLFECACVRMCMSSVYVHAVCVRCVSVFTCACVCLNVCVCVCVCIHAYVCFLCAFALGMSRKECNASMQETDGFPLMRDPPTLRVPPANLHGPHVSVLRY